MLAQTVPNAQAAALVAAAVAARINATLAAKQQQSGAGASGQTAAPPPPTTFDADVDINHSRVRHILVKGMTHAQVRDSLFASRNRHPPTSMKIVLWRAYHSPIEDDVTQNILCDNALGTRSLQIHESTGASIITRGKYKQIGECSPDQPLHLHVTADSQEKVDLAVRRIKEMMITEPLKVCAAQTASMTLGFITLYVMALVSM
jgi:hypothetical protein